MKGEKYNPFTIESNKEVWLQLLLDIKTFRIEDDEYHADHENIGHTRFVPERSLKLKNGLFVKYKSYSSTRVHATKTSYFAGFKFWWRGEEVLEVTIDSDVNGWIEECYVKDIQTYKCIANGIVGHYKFKENKLVSPHEMQDIFCRCFYELSLVATVRNIATKKGQMLAIQEQNKQLEIKLNRNKNKVSEFLNFIKE